MTLWLLRHGEAEARARSDAERPLTERGRKEVRRCAERLRGRPLQYILASPYLRAQQTAEIVREVLGLALPLVVVAMNRFTRSRSRSRETGGDPDGGRTVVRADRAAATMR